MRFRDELGAQRKTETTYSLRLYPPVHVPLCLPPPLPSAPAGALDAHFVRFQACYFNLSPRQIALATDFTEEQGGRNL